MQSPFWTADKLASEGSFTLACNMILAECTTAYRAGDLKKLRELEERIYGAAPLVRTDPLLSRFEYTYCIVGLHVGLAMVDTGDFEYAALIADYVDATRTRALARRAALGQPERRNTEVLFTLLNLLGDLKKQAGIEFRDAVFTPAQMWEHWREAAMRTWEWTEELKVSNPQRVRRQRQALGWAGVQVIACCTRYLPQVQVAGMISFFNRMFGRNLALAPFHFRDNAPLAENAWYWDYEMYKLDFSGAGDRQTIEFLWMMREQEVARFAKRESYDLTSYLEGAEREKRDLLRRCNLELVGAQRAS